MARVNITPIRLRPVDKQTINDCKVAYNLYSFADSVRLSSRVVTMLGLSAERIAKLNSQYEALTPDAVHLVIGEDAPPKRKVVKRNPNT